MMDSELNKCRSGGFGLIARTNCRTEPDQSEEEAVKSLASRIALSKYLDGPAERNK
jgi:hypothetical protein